MNSEQRRRAYEAINALGAVVSLEDVSDPPDRVQACILLPYHPRTCVVLAGPWFGFLVKDAKRCAQREAMQSDLFEHISCTQTTLRPWWRLWQKTPALVIQLEVRP